MYIFLGSEIAFMGRNGITLGVEGQTKLYVFAFVLLLCVFILYIFCIALIMDPSKFSYIPYNQET